MISAISTLIDLWKRRAADALPADAMLINKHTRELEEASEADRLEAALRTIMDAHKFNVAQLRPNEVHEICCRALGTERDSRPVLPGQKAKFTREWLPFPSEHPGFTIPKGSVVAVLEVKNNTALVQSKMGDNRVWVPTGILNLVVDQPLHELPKREATTRAPAAPRPEPQLVVSDGQTWKIRSRNERETTLGGRYYFAVRCKPNTRWAVIELHRPLDAPGGSKELRRLDYKVESTGALSAAVRYFHESRKP